MRDLITVEAICDRYQCERHKAASIMYKLPNFKVGNRLFAYQHDLEDWEKRQINYPGLKAVKQQKEVVFIVPRKKAQ